MVCAGGERIIKGTNFCRNEAATMVLLQNRFSYEKDVRMLFVSKTCALTPRLSNLHKGIKISIIEYLFKKSTRN